MICHALGCHRVGTPGDSEDGCRVPEAVRPGPPGPAAAVAVERARDGSGRPLETWELRAPTPQLVTVFSFPNASPNGLNDTFSAFTLVLGSRTNGLFIFGPSSETIVSI